MAPCSRIEFSQTAIAGLSLLLPMPIFFGMQRFFVRGLLAGSVKG